MIPLAYGDGALDRIRAASGGRVDAFIDTFGHGYVELALQLGVPADRIDTIIDFDAAAKDGVKTAGNSAAATAAVLGELASLIDAGQLEIPIARVYPSGPGPRRLSGAGGASHAGQNCIGALITIGEPEGRAAAPRGHSRSVDEEGPRRSVTT